jgi:hypothetical protein
MVAVGTGCSPYKYNDDDNLCSKAKPLPPVVVVKDELNSKMGDVADCRTLKYFKNARAKVTYRIGTAFEQHNLKGLLTLYNEDGQVLDQKGVDPTIPKYDFDFEVTGNRPYYVEFKITEGQYAYQAQVQFTKVDPCSKCTASQECVDGACREKVRVCDPACDSDDGMACEDGQCVYQCEDRCKRKKRRGYVCDVETGDCVRARKSCSPRCKTGYRCNYRVGRCYKKSPPKPPCAGGCKPGTICKNNKCVAIGGKTCPSCPSGQTCSQATGYQCVKDGGSVTQTGPIRGRVASILRAGTSSILYLNRGRSHGVRAGATGTLCGKLKITVTNVYATRSKARSNKSLEEIGDCKSFSVRRL